MKCQNCGGQTYGDNLICDKCRYTEEDAVDMMEDPRDNPLIGEDDSWVNDPDMGSR